MNEELKPCPFCGADEVSAHQPDCYFTLRDKGAMRSELAKAWNRRTPTVGGASAAAVGDGLREMQAATLRADLAELQSFVDDLDDGSASRAFYNVRAAVIEQLHADSAAAAAPGASIDTPEFRAVLSTYNQGAITEGQFIAHIDTHVRAECERANQRGRLAAIDDYRPVVDELRAQLSSCQSAQGASELPPLPDDYYILAPQRIKVYDEDHMHQYARDYAAQLALSGQFGARQEPVAWLRFWAAQYSTEDGNIGTDEGLKVCEPHEFGMDGRPAFPVYASPVSAQGAPKSDVKRMESDGGQPASGSDVGAVGSEGGRHD